MEAGVSAGDLELVFPTCTGRPDPHSNIVQQGWQPIQVKAGIVTESGEAKYRGLHAARHFFASWCANRRIDGGLELPLKIVSESLGHSTIPLTADRYSHLFPRGDDAAELAAAERALIA